MPEQRTFRGLPVTSSRPVRVLPRRYTGLIVPGASAPPDILTHKCAMRLPIPKTNICSTLTEKEQKFVLVHNSRSVGLVRWRSTSRWEHTAEEAAPFTAKKAPGKRGRSQGSNIIFKDASSGVDLRPLAPHCPPSSSTASWGQAEPSCQMHQDLNSHTAVYSSEPCFFFFLISWAFCHKFDNNNNNEFFKNSLNKIRTFA